MTQTPQKPPKVRTAITLLIATIALSIIFTLLFTPSQAAANNVPVEAALIGALGGQLFVVFLVWMIARGRNWARITMLVLLLLGLPMVFTQLPAMFGVSPIATLLSVASWGLQGVALVLLFLKDSSSWFAACKAQRA